MMNPADQMHALRTGCGVLAGQCRQSLSGEQWGVTSQHEHTALCQVRQRGQRDPHRVAGAVLLLLHDQSRVWVR